MICFCMSGTSSNGSSTPRSPRATMMASEASRMPHEVLERGVLLDLRDQLGAARHQRAQPLHVLRPTNEGERDVVHAQGDGLLHVLPILLGHRRARSPRVPGGSCPCSTSARHRSAPPLPPGRHRTPVTSTESSPSSSRMRAPTCTSRGKPVVGGGDLAGSSIAFGREEHALPGIQPQRLLQRTDPDTRPLEVHENRGATRCGPG